MLLHFLGCSAIRSCLAPHDQAAWGHSELLVPSRGSREVGGPVGRCGFRASSKPQCGKLSQHLAAYRNSGMALPDGCDLGTLRRVQLRCCLGLWLHLKV